MNGRILVPLDGSESAERALRFAEVIPSPIVRIISVEPVRLTAARNRWAREEFAPNGASWAVSSTTAYLNLIALPFREQGRTVEVVVTTGDPGQRIAEAATDADLIIMATRGGGMTRRLLGGVADDVARHAPAPTLLVRDEHAPAVRRLVVPLDGSKEAEEALPLAEMLARQFGASLHLVRVIDPSLTLSRTDELQRDTEAYLQKQLDGLGEPTGATLEVRVRRAGTVGESLLAVAREGDLFVMASRRRGRLGQLLLGTKISDVVRKSPVPVILVPAIPGHMATALRAAREGEDISGE